MDTELPVSHPIGMHMGMSMAMAVSWRIGMGVRVWFSHGQPVIIPRSPNDLEGLTHQLKVQRSPLA